MKFLVTLIVFPIIFFVMAVNKNPDKGPNNIQNQKPLFTFGILADIQYCDCDAQGTRFYRSSCEKLREALTTLKDNSVNFTINLGDIIDRDYKSYAAVLNIIDSSSLQIYHVAGNHDYSVDERYKKKIPVIQSSKDGYYSFVYENFRFIFLNGNELSTYISGNKSVVKQAYDYLAKMKSNGEINAVEWNGGIGSKQLAWLKNQLDEASRINQKVFIICHFPVVPEDIHNLLNYKEVRRILENYNNIVAWFNGHNHAGNYGNFNMIHFVTFKGMVETEDQNSFALVEVYKNKIWIRGYGREKSQILAY